MLQYSPKIVTDGLVMCLDPSQNKSYPTDLPVKNGLVMWMDAADDTTFSYSSGTTVSQWRDKSGFNYHMVPKSSGPTRSVSLNSRKALAFTTSQTIGNNTINLASSANTVFVVSRLTGATNGRVLTCNLDSGGNNWLLGHHGGTSNAYYAEGWVYDSGGASTSFQIYMGDWSGSSTDLANFYINGTAYATNSTAASQGPNKLGINYYSIQTSACEAAEIIVFNRILTAVERRLINTYLGQKWGILNTDRSIIDLSGNNNNGLLGNGTTADMPLFDVYNKGALKFDGSSDYLTVADNVILNPATVTVSMWLKRNAYQSSICNFLRRNDRDAYALMAIYNTDTVWFRIRNSLAAVVDAQTSMPLNTWTNLVGTFDGSNVRIYKDGVFANIASNTSPISYAGSTIRDLIIARDDIVSGRYAPINVGSTLIYNRVLTAAEILANYEAQKSKFANTIVQQGLVLNLDAGNPYSYAGAGTTWYDTSGNSYNSTLTNGPTYSTTNGGIINLDGSDDYAISTVTSIPASSTVGIWIKSSNYDVKIPLSINGDSYGSGPNIFFYNSKITWNIGDSADNPFTNSSYPDSNWHYIVVTNDASTNAKLYIDGVLIGTASYRTTASTTSNNFWIGRFHGDNNYTINASIGQVQLYSRVLSASEILQNYNATKGRFGL